MFIACVTDTQPKECKGVLKRLMDVVNVDYGEYLTVVVMKENNDNVEKNESEVQSYLQSAL